MSIIKGPLDQDLYAFTMSKIIREHFPGHYVRYELFNRTTDIADLAQVIDRDELQQELDAVLNFDFTAWEGGILLDLPYFSGSDVRTFMKVDRPRARVVETNGWLNVLVEGPWEDVIFWETQVLAIITELYGRTKTDELPNDALNRWGEKVEFFRQHQGVEFVEFGTRRRHSSELQRALVHSAKQHIGNSIKGTSNVRLAALSGLPAVGTMAHQLFMVRGARAHSQRELRNATIEVLEAWEDVYHEHPNMMVALTDTFTTSFFLQHVPRYFFETYTGFRQDSGHPLRWFRQMQDMLTHLSDRDKKYVFSDGLTPNVMKQIYDVVHPNSVFGWGTNMTNDAGYKPLNVVMKPTAADGRPCIKLSDGAGKTTGPQLRIDELKRLVK